MIYDLQVIFVCVFQYRTGETKKSPGSVPLWERHRPVLVVSDNMNITRSVSICQALSLLPGQRLFSCRLVSRVGNSLAAVRYGLATAHFSICASPVFRSKVNLAIRFRR